MLQRELLVVLSFVMAVFLLVAGAGWFAVQKLNATSKRLVVDTLPGLVNAGEAQERMHEERQTMREMLSAHTATERLHMIDWLHANTTDDQWQAYADSIFEPEDRQNFQALMLVRSNYLQTCPKFFEFVRAGRIDEAAEYYNGDQSRLFQDYVASAKTVFDYNVRQGEKRGRLILNATRYAPLAIGALCVLIFVFGLALGLRTALGGAK